jgi:hypothetical protein
MSQARRAVQTLVVVTVVTGLGIAVIHNNQTVERQVRGPASFGIHGVSGDVIVVEAGSDNDTGPAAVGARLDPRVAGPASSSWAQRAKLVAANAPGLDCFRQQDSCL